MTDEHRAVGKSTSERTNGVSADNNDGVRIHAYAARPCIALYGRCSWSSYDQGGSRCAAADVRGADGRVPSRRYVAFSSLQGFNSRLWTLGIAAIAGGAITNHFLKKYVKGDEEAAKPFFTDLIESCSTSTDKIREANQEHIDLSIKRAEAQLMIQDAQKPSTHRVRFP